MRKPTAKHCPFCKSKDVFVERYDTCVYGAMCNNCGAQAQKVEHAKYVDDPRGDDLGERDALRMWNARSSASRQRILVACEMSSLATSN